MEGISLEQIKGQEIVEILSDIIQKSIIQSKNKGEDELDLILVWDFDEISLEMTNKLVKVCNQKEVYLDGFLTKLAM